MPAKKSPSTAPKKPAKAAGARTTARPAAKKASTSRPAGGAAAAGKATRPTVVALRPDDARTEVAAPEGGSDRAPGFTLPLIGWRVTAPTLPALPTLPDEITLPVVGWTVNANEREEITELLAGHICAAVGLKNLITGDTICTEKAPVVLESIDFPAPVIELAVEPKTKADQEKMGMALAKLAQEDPTFRVHTDPDSGQTIIAGMGELHLEIIVDRMMREYKVEANVGKPQVAYRETIRSNAEAEGKYIRQTGGSGNYGHAKIRISPNEPGKGYEFSNDIKGGVIPKEYIKPIDQGIQDAMTRGVLAGYEMVDIKVSLYDGSYHDVDSNEMAFKIAGSMAFKEAARKAKPVLLEPVMDVEVTVPEEFMGTIIGDLNSRRGRIEGMEMVGGTQAIKAIVPLSTMFGYATHMRSSTQGRANYSMQFKQYEEAPKSVSEEIIAKVQGKE